MKNIKSYFLMFFAMALTAVAWGQETVRIREIEIDGYYDGMLYKDLDETVGIINALGRSDLSSLAFDVVGDAIKRMPGLYLSGPVTTNRNIRMAGLDKEYQAITVNGYRPAGGEDRRDFKLDRIPVSMVDSVKLYVNQPSWLGYDGIGGAIDIRLKEADFKAGLDIRTAFKYMDVSDNIDPEAEVEYKDHKGPWAYMAGISYLPFRRTESTIYSALDGSFEPDDRTETLEGYLGALNLSLVRKVSSGEYFSRFFLSDYTENTDVKDGLSLKSETGDYVSWQREYTSEEKLRKYYEISGGYRGDIFDNITGEFSADASYYRDRKYKDSFKEKTGGSQIDLEYEDQYVYYGAGRADMRVTDSGISFGVRASYNFRDVDRDVYSRKISEQLDYEHIDSSFEVEEGAASFYIDKDIELGSGVVAAPGVSCEYFSGVYRTVVEEGINRIFTYSPKLSLKARMGRHAVFKGEFSRQIERPPFMYVAPVDKIKVKKERIEAGNPKLDPAYSWNTDLRLEYRAGDFAVSAGGFFKDVRDMIAMQYIGKSTDSATYDYDIYKPVNISEGSVYGLLGEAEFSFDLFDNVNLLMEGNYTYYGSRIRDPNTGDYNRLEEQPDYVLNLITTLYADSVGIVVQGGLNIIGERKTPASVDIDGNAIESVTYESIAQIDLKVKYYVNEWLQVFISGENIGNEKSVETSGLVAKEMTPGILLRCGSRIML